MPATNSTSERSFSALRRIFEKHLSQARMNHLMILHYHQDLTDSLDMKQVANDVISAKESRISVFAKFT